MAACDYYHNEQMSQETNEALQGCFKETDWDVLSNSLGEHIDDLTGCITEYQLLRE